MPRILPGPPCDVCGEPSVAKKLCDKHYRRWKRLGHTGLSRPDRGSREKHPLYGIWVWTRRGQNSRCERWDDFWAFVEDVGERPSPHHSLRRVQPTRPYGPDNCYWAETSSNEDRAAYMRKWRADNPARARDIDLRKSYGIGLSEWEALYESQDGKCAICNREDRAVYKDGRKRNLAVDHCHDTKAVRGLLCTNCNRAIGLLDHDPDLLRKAIEYLKR